MKNMTMFPIALSLILFAVLGCGSLNPLSDRGTSTGSSTPSNEPGTGQVLGDDRIGVPECDELFDELTKAANSPDDNWVVKATKAYFFDSLRESIRKSIEQNKNDRDSMAKECTKYKAQLDKYLAEEKAKKK
jgi:hypothetical protein